MLIAYIDPQTNYVAVTCLTESCSLEQAYKLGIIPSNKPILKFEENDVVCKQDPGQAFFDCWTFDNKQKPTEVVVDMEKAKMKWKQHLISMRDQRLDFLDNIQVRALGRGDTAEVNRIEEVKQRLRDFPQTINMNNIKNVIQLMDYNPSILFAK